MRSPILVALVVLVAAQFADAAPDCKKATRVEIEIACDAKQCTANKDVPIEAAVTVKKLALPKGAVLVIRGRGIKPVAQGEVICPWTHLDDLLVLTLDLKSIPFGSGNSKKETDDTKLTDPKKIPDEGDPLDVRFVDVVRVGSGCSGIVVSNRHVLTAAHCANERWLEAPNGMTRRDVTVHVHEHLDIALFTVGPRAFLLPARTRATKPTDKLVTGVVRLVGFGAVNPDGTGNVERTKYYGRTSVTDWVCDADRALSTGCKPELEFVVRGGGSDSCEGDSGGPLFDKKNGHWRLFGITSRRLPDAPTLCGGGGIYTHVGAISEWLNGWIMKEKGND